MPNLLTVPIDSADLVHEVRLIHPDEASQLLLNTRNASLVDTKQVASYARDIAAGTWKLNGDPIILDTDGVLLSGRLRLHACVRAQKPFPTLIVRNVDPRHFDSIDALRRRTVSDIMSIRKEKHGRALAAALTVLWRFANDDFPSQTKRASSQALLAVLEENPDIRFSVESARPTTPGLPHGLGAALHFLFSKVDPVKADAFFSELGKEGPYLRSPTGLLKRQLDESLAAGGSRNPAQLAAITIKTWESFRSGRPMALVRYVPGVDQFPKISGLHDQVRLDGVVRSTGSIVEDSTHPMRQLHVRVEIVTPERARSILERNDRNRAIAGAVVDKYARDMKSGAWALNGQTIKISDSGRLLDGQHRCAAAVRANTTFPAIIVEGLSDDVFDTFDVGIRRSISTILKDRGENNTAVLGAVLRQVWLIDNNLITVKNVPPTVSELLDTLEKNPGIRESIKFSNKVRDIGPSILLALHYFFNKVNEVKATEFMERLGDGVMLASDSPILKLREALLEDRANKKGRLGDSERAALIIKAWNSFAEDRPMRVLKWQSAGPRREAFPSISQASEAAQ